MIVGSEETGVSIMLLADKFYLVGQKINRLLCLVGSALLATYLSALLLSLDVAAQTTPSGSSATITAPVPSSVIDPEDKIILSGIYRFKEQLNALNRDDQEISINIIMPDDQGNARKTSVSDEFKQQLLNDDISDVLTTMKEWKLEFKYPMHTRELMLGIEEEITPQSLLFRAALVNHSLFAKKLLADNDIDLNHQYMQGKIEVTALGVATAGQSVEMIELLLNAGADPNLRGKGLGSPLSMTVGNYDLRSMRALFDAGATLAKSFGRRGIRPELLNKLIHDDQFEMVSLLLANGMKLKSPRPGSIKITPLMQALVSGRSRMALGLLPHSDPRHYTGKLVEQNFSDIEDINTLPRSNALFLAQLRRSELGENVEQAIEARIEELDGKEAVLLSRLQAMSSMHDFIYLQGRSMEANEMLKKDLAEFSSVNAGITASADLSPLIDRLLAKTIEFSIISGQAQTISDQFSNLENNAGQWVAMLKTISATRTGEYEPMLEEWQDKYSGAETQDWDYSRLNNWIGSLKDESVKKRLYRAVDFFEFSVSSFK